MLYCKPELPPNIAFLCRICIDAKLEKTVHLLMLAQICFTAEQSSKGTNKTILPLAIPNDKNHWHHVVIRRR